MSHVVKIVVIGDAKTGKSSLITSSVTNEFSKEVLGTLPPLVDEPAGGKNGPTRKFVDTSAVHGDLLLQSKRQTALQHADVVCIVYDVTRPETFDSVASRWMPELVGLSVTVPVVLLGNKLDIRDPNDRASMAIRQRIVPLVQQYGNQIEWCLECSAKTLECVQEAFTRAVESVLYPSAPLFDVTTQQLSQKFIAALANIFKLIDYDRDGFVTDRELLGYQQRYNPDMTMETIGKLKDVAKNFSEDSAPEGKLSVDGFVILHQFLVQNSKFKVIWDLLSSYGYGPDLLQTKEYLHPDIDWQPGNFTQLGKRGFNFLLQQFERFDADRDGLLNVQEQKEMYETTPSDPFRFRGPLMCETDQHAPEALTENGLLALWCMKTYLSHKDTAKYLRFMGYEGPMKEAIDVLPGKKGSKVHQLYRHTFECFVLGSGGCGKSAALRSFVGKGKTTPIDQCVVNSCHRERSTGSKFLIVREFSEDAIEELIKSDDVSNIFSSCDVVCLAYNANESASFMFAASLYEELKERGITLPFVFMACKTDLPFAEFPESALSPEQYCSQQELFDPLQFSSEREDTARVFNDIVDIAINPELALRRKTTWTRIFGFSFGAIAFGVGAYLLRNNWHELSKWLRPFLVLPQNRLLKQ